MSPDRLQRAADHTEDANKVSGREDSDLDISVQGVEAVKVHIGKIFVNIEKNRLYTTYHHYHKINSD